MTSGTGIDSNERDQNKGNKESKGSNHETGTGTTCKRRRSKKGGNKDSAKDNDREETGTCKTEDTDDVKGDENVPADDDIDDNDDNGNVVDDVMARNGDNRKDRLTMDERQSGVRTLSTLLLWALLGVAFSCIAWHYKAVKQIPPVAGRYAKEPITNQLDFNIRHLLDEADSLLDKGFLGTAYQKFSAIVTMYPDSPRAWWGKVRAGRLMRGRAGDKVFLQKAAGMLQRVCYLPNLKEQLLNDVMRELIYLMTSKLRKPKVYLLTVSRTFYTRFPHVTAAQLAYADILSRLSRYEETIDLYHKVVDKHPDWSAPSASLGCAYLHVYNVSLMGAKYLQRALDLGFPEKNKGYFYAKLATAYNRLNDTKRELETVDRAVEEGVMISREQRSTNNADTEITSKPFWTIEETGQRRWLQIVQGNWEIMRKEALKLMDKHTGLFKPQREGITDTGDWRFLAFWTNGKISEEACTLAPWTCRFLSRFADATHCKRGQIKLSVMPPGAHIFPHSGPTNCRLRAHLGLVVPEGPRIKVLNETRTWSEGELLIFDDSYMHEVWNDGTEFRLILIIDFWHPNLTNVQKQTLGKV